MFILTKVADLVQVTPQDFHKKSMQAIEDNINEKYANKVIQKIGLCICLYDITWASEGLIGHGTGTANVNAEFRLLVFRPFKGEVIVGRVTKCTPEGIHIRTDFFDNIFVEAEELPEGSEYDHNQQIWIWRSEGEIYYFDIFEMVRLVVESEEWNDQTPTKPTATIGEDAPPEEKLPPYIIKASMKAHGLGVCLWWEG